MGPLGMGKKQRFEYVGRMGRVVPAVRSEGTGTYNLYGFREVVRIAVADAMMRMGIRANGVAERLDYVERVCPRLFEEDVEAGLEWWLYVESDDGVYRVGRFDLRETLGMSQVSVLIINLAEIKRRVTERLR